MRAVPGRKAVIFFSVGFQALGLHGAELVHRYTPGPLDGLYHDTSVQAALRSLADLANRASVVLYTLDPTGLTTDLAGANFGPAPGDPPNRSVTSQYFSATQQSFFARHARHQGMIQLAEQTGGLALRNRNDLGETLRLILADHAGYYLLGYEPKETTFCTSADGAEFREVKVAVKRRGLSVRSRKGFYSVPDEVIARDLPPMTH